METNKHKKKEYQKPLSRLFETEMRQCVLVSASKSSYSKAQWVDDEEEDEIIAGRCDYDYNKWDNESVNGISSGRQSYGSAEW